MEVWWWNHLVNWLWSDLGEWDSRKMEVWQRSHLVGQLWSNWGEWDSTKMEVWECSYLVSRLLIDQGEWDPRKLEARGCSHLHQPRAWRVWWRTWRSKDAAIFINWVIRRLRAWRVWWGWRRSKDVASLLVELLLAKGSESLMEKMEVWGRSHLYQPSC